MRDERARRASSIARQFDKQGNTSEAEHWRAKAAQYEKEGKK